MKFEIEGEEEEKIVRLNLRKTSSGNVLLIANEENLLMINKEGELYRYKHTHMNKLGFKVDEDGAITEEQ